MKKLFQKFMKLPFIDKIMSIWYEKGDWKYIIYALCAVFLTLNVVKLADGFDILEFFRGNILEYTFSFDVKITTAVFGIGVFLTYLIAVIVDFGVLKSISISYYSVKPRWLFQLMMWCSIVTIFVLGNCNLYYLVCLLFAIMTCNPSVNGGNIYFIPHCIGAISAIILAVLGAWIVFDYISIPFFCIDVVLFIFLLSTKWQWLKERKLWFVEVCSLSLVIVSLLLNLF